MVGGVSGNDNKNGADAEDDVPHGRRVAGDVREMVTYLVAADMRRLTLRAGIQLEPPHVGCYGEREITSAAARRS